MKGKLMDFGCGCKPYRPLLTNVTEYIGVDYDSAGHPHRGEEIDVFYDGIHLPFRPNTFDSVFTSEVFEHVFNLEAVLPEINRVMKPGGNILITCPFVWNLHEMPFDYARYTPFALQHLLEASGFRVMAMERIGNYVTALTQMRVLYVSAYLLPAIPLLRRIKYCSILLVTFMNVIGVLKSRLLPCRNDLYLSNIVLARKT
jgi:SAM-dependent methyltransferase